MARDLVDYVALALVRNSPTDETDSYFGRPSDYSGDIDQVLGRAEELCDFRISRAVLNGALRALAECGLLRISDDDYSSTFVKIKVNQFEGFFERASQYFAKAEQDYGGVSAISAAPSDFPAATALLKHELFEDYREFGSPWLDRALQGLKRRVGPDGSLDDLINGWSLSPPIQAPASDRVVNLSDNQRSELEQASNALIEAVERENSIDGDTWLRQLTLGQLKAGRELIRAQSLRTWLLYSSLVTALGGLIERYGSTALGEAAKKLLDLLVEHIFRK